MRRLVAALVVWGLLILAGTAWSAASTLVDRPERVEGYVVLAPPMGKVNVLAVDPQGHWLASGSGDNTLRVWDPATGTLLHTLTGHTGSVRTLVADPEGRWLASDSWDNTVRIWNPATGTLLHTLAGHTGSVSAMTADPQGRWLASGSFDNSVRVWDPATGTLLHALTGHTGSVQTLAVDPQGRWLASGSGDDTVRVWEPGTGALLHTLEGHTARVSALAADPQGRWLASGSQDNTVRLWHPATGTLLHTLTGHTDAVRALAADPRGRWLTSGSDDETVRVWDPATGTLLHTLTGQTGSVSALAADPEGRWVASGSSTDPIVRVWDPATATLLRTLEGHTGSVLALAADPQGRWLASGSGNNIVRAESSATGTSERWRVAGGWLASSSSTDPTVRVWDPATGTLLHTLTGHTGWIKALAADPQGRWLASGATDGTVRIWSTNSWTTIRMLIGGSGRDWTTWDANSGLARWESGGLLLQQTPDRGLQPIPPTPTANGADLALVSSTPPEQIAADGLATWTIEVRNSSNIPAHWIRAESASDSDSLAVYGSRTEIRLNPGEQTKLELKVALRRLPAGKDPAGWVQGWPERASLPPIRVLSAGGAGPLVPGGQEIPVERPSLAPSGELLEDGKTIRVTLANQGTGSSGPLRIRLGSPSCRAQAQTQSQTQHQAEIGTGKPTDSCRRLLRLLDSLVEDAAVQSIPALDARPVSFAAQERLNVKDLERLSLLAYRTQGPATDWDFAAIPISGALPVWLLSAAALLLLATAAAVYYWRRYQHPLVTTICRDAQALFALAPERLPEAERRLRLIRRLDGAMDALGLPRASLDRVRAWLSAPAAEQARQIAERLGAACHPLEPDGQRAEPPVWRLGLQAFPQNLSTLALTLVPAGSFSQSDPEGLLQGLRERLDAVRGLGTGGLPLLILSADGETQRDLNRRTAERRDRLIAPAPEVLTRLLLAPEPALVLARALAERIPRTELSPYQTGGGVQDPRMFFGRAGLLDHIVNRDPGNYLVVGGRQVGKSSLLQAVARALAGSTRVRVHYCALGGADLAEPLAAALGLAAGAGLADIESLLHRSGGARPRVLLIDESDAFVRADADRDYAVLKRLRGLSESGLAYFSFAGYWTLFERSALDFHSPLKNFGELIQVEELEWEACLALVQRWLGLSLASNALAERLVRDCGQRANLIAMACHQLVARVRPDQREIGAADLEAVLAGERIRDELLGNWHKLVADETEQRLDRMAVYASVDWNDFGYGELAARLSDAGLTVDPERLERSLRRLRLAFVLGLADGRYCYRVPLQQRLIRQDDPGIRLRQEVANQGGFLM